MHQEIFKTLWAFLKQSYLKDHQRLILGWPVLFGGGILTYFSLSHQPSTLSVIVVFLGSLLLLLPLMRHQLHWISIAVFAFCLGGVVSHLRTITLNTLMIDQRVKHFSFIGIVADIDDTQRGVRVLVHLNKQPPGYELVRTIRLSLQAHLKVPEIGTEIRGEATLLPFGGIISESGYNFRRVAYFQGVSATGQLLDYQEKTLNTNGWLLFLKASRKQITDKIMAQFLNYPDVGGIMAALVTGARGGIAQGTRQAFTDAGLAHLLAISGLHLSLIAGFIFLLIRRGLSLSMRLAESYDLKKIAACLTIPFLIFYLLISGCGIPALRAFLMILLGMVAVVLDRNPLSMRLVCFAASIILLIYPESLLLASFQMSFAAVVALIGVYENGWRPFREWGMRARGPRKLVLYLVGIIATTLIATYATTPLTIAIFQRFSLQGVLGNLVAIPLTGFIIMPLIVVFLILLPLGMEFLVTPFLKIAIQFLINVAGTVAHLPGAAIIVPEQSPIFLALFVLGGIWFCLWQQQWRYLGIIPMLIAFCCLKLTADPKIIIPEREQVVYGFDGQRAFCLGCGSSGFSQEMFLRQVGHQKMDRLADKSVTLFWDKITLFLTIEKVSKSKLKAYCQKVDYLFSPRSIFYACPNQSKVKDRQTIHQQGTIIANLRQNGFIEIKTSCELQGCRPWSEAKCCR